MPDNEEHISDEKLPVQWR